MRKRINLDRNIFNKVLLYGFTKSIVDNFCTDVPKQYIFVKSHDAMTYHQFASFSRGRTYWAKGLLREKFKVDLDLIKFKTTSILLHNQTCQNQQVCGGVATVAFIFYQRSENQLKDFLFQKF